jgi:hypothetical protein
MKNMLYVGTPYTSLASGSEYASLASNAGSACVLPYWGGPGKLFSFYIIFDKISRFKNFQI